MTAVIRRRGPFVALLAAVGLALTGCASGPSQINAAAIVGDRTVSVDRVQELVDKAVAEEPSVQELAKQHKLDIVSRAVLRQLVLHELLGEYSETHDLTVDPSQVALLASQLREETSPPAQQPTADKIAENAVTRVFDSTELATDYLKLAKLGIATGPKLKVTLDYTVFVPDSESPTKTGSLKDQAYAAARKLAEGGVAGSEAFFDAEKEARRNVQLGKDFYAALSPNEDLATLIYGTDPNSAFAFQVNGEQTFWVVGLLRARDVNATLPPEAAEQEEPKQFDALRATTLGPRLLQKTVEQVGVKVSPRYGVWDIAAMGVAPSEAETTGAVFPVRAATP